VDPLKSVPILALIPVLIPSAWAAQRGTAESGCYPLAFYGTTFTGVVTSANDGSGEIKLTYSDPKTGKTDDLMAMLEEGYLVKNRDGKLVELSPSQIKPGTRLRVYFYGQERKLDGKDGKREVIFDIQGAWNQRRQFKTFKPFKIGTTAEIAPISCEQ
jgi:hypothetical protein